MEREHPGSPLHAHVTCLEMSCRGEPCAFPPRHPCLGAGRIGSCTLYLLRPLLLFLGGREALEILYIHLYIYTHVHALVLKGKHCMIVIEMMLR